MSSQRQVAKLASDLILEAATFLHDRDRLRLTFSGRVPRKAVSKLLQRSTEAGKRQTF